jgi:uncharacterized protein with GYD domain
MATYIVLGKFDRATVNADINAALNPSDTPRRMADITKLDSAFVQLRTYWMTSGPYDMVGVVEADTHEHLLAYLAALSYLARVQTTTLAATDSARISAVFEDAHTKIQTALDA